MGLFDKILKPVAEVYCKNKSDWEGSIDGCESNQALIRCVMGRVELIDLAERRDTIHASERTHTRRLTINEELLYLIGTINEKSMW